MVVRDDDPATERERPEPAARWTPAAGAQTGAPPTSSGSPGIETASPEVEAMVTAVWAEVLGSATVEAEDDFLELGGDSLLATQFVARLNRALGLDLTVADLFAASTAGAMARIVEEALLREAERQAADEVGAGAT